MKVLGKSEQLLNADWLGHKTICSKWILRDKFVESRQRKGQSKQSNVQTQCSKEEAERAWYSSWYYK